MNFIKDISGQGIEIKDNLIGIDAFVQSSLGELINEKELLIVRYSNSHFFVLPDQSSPKPRVFLMRFFSYDSPDNSITENPKEGDEIMNKYFENRLSMEEEAFKEIDDIMSQFNSLIEKHENGILSDEEYDKEYSKLIESIPEEDRELFLR